MNKLEKMQKNNTMMYTGTAIIHVLYVILFAIQHSALLAVVNVGVAIVYFIIANQARTAEKFAKLYAVATTVMVMFLVLHYVMLGPSFGFQYIAFGSIPLIYYVLRMELFDSKMSLFCSVVAVVVFCVISVACTTLNYPIVEISTLVQRIIVSINIMMAFFVSIATMQNLIDDTDKEAGMLKKQNSDLDVSASVDVLTGLMNRRNIQKYMDEAFKNARGNGEEFSLLMGDIDNFKMVNDTYGHDCGDLVLKNIANILRKEIREEDVVFRWGGEEFLVLVYDRKYVAKRIAEKCLAAIEASTVTYKDTELKVTMTMGGASYYQGATYENLIERADKNLYVGKNNGKNQVVI